MTPLRRRMIDDMTLRNFTPDTIDVYDLSSLDTIFFGAAPLAQSVREWTQERFPGVRLHENYGSTESSVATNLRPPDLPRKPGSIGQPFYLTVAILLDKNRVFPKWFGYLNLCNGLTEIVVSPAWIFRTGVLAWNGQIAWWLDMVVFGIYTGVFIFLLRQMIQREDFGTGPLPELSKAAR